MFKSNAFYFTCGELSTCNKLIAVQHSINTGAPIHFNIPTFLTDYGLHKEPKQSWSSLCKSHALYLRQKYDTVRIFYSGGCDSRTVLESFILNDIHVDEVIVLKSGIEDADYEINQHAIPFLKHYKNQLQKTNIKIVKPTYGDYHNFYSNPYWFEDLADKTNNKTAFHFRLNHWLENTDLYKGNGKTVDIQGIDKPRIMYFKGQWFVYFLDVEIKYEDNKESDWCNFFYDDPQVCSKQAHLLKHAIEKYIPYADWNKVCLGEEKYEHFYNLNAGRLDGHGAFPSKMFTKFDGTALQATMSNVKINESRSEKVFCRNNKEKIAISNIINDDITSFNKWHRTMYELSLLGDGKWFNGGRPELGTIGVFGPFINLKNGVVSTVDELFPEGFNISP